MRKLKIILPIYQPYLQKTEGEDIILPQGDEPQIHMVFFIWYIRRDN